MNHEIPTNFAIPREHRNRVFLFYSDTFCLRLKPVSRKSIALAQHDRLKISEADATEAQKEQYGSDHARGLDWMQETMEYLRFLCGGDE